MIYQKGWFECTDAAPADISTIPIAGIPHNLSLPIHLFKTSQNHGNAPDVELPKKNLKKSDKGNLTRSVR
ncbi:MAG: hypothetical protein AAY43_12025 [Methanosarcina sp. 795]|nr:MAG: hypothetical protein AAY43_12025 [Methanosarcina sp. 795]